jgi:signal transduction histidine kinase
MNNLLLLFLLFGALTIPFEKSDAQSSPPAAIRVVMDDNYPPYSFKDGAGNLQGILPDQWRLWEQITGTKVNIVALDWDDALNRMKAGEFDVIDTIFKTPERMAWLDFTRPYARLEVPIFFNREIAGIHNAASLKGFAVAAKRGDNAVDLLLQQGVKEMILFNSYEGVIRAAQQGKVNVFVVDQPPALYFLHKFGIRHRFKQSPPINVGEFRRAVKKGNRDLLFFVDSGFAQISPQEIHRITRKWEGSSLFRNPLLVPYLAGFVALLLLLILFLLIWTRTLRQVVTQQTAELKSANKELLLSNEQFRAKNEEMDRFVYSASHDLKAPLITFQTYLGFLEQDLHKTEQTAIQQDIAFMQSAASRMKSLLDDLLTLSRVGQIVHPPETITFYDLGNEALRVVAGSIATRGVKVTWSSPDLILRGDRTRLVEIWQNLIDNAVKFMGEQSQPLIELGWEGIFPDVCFYVRDNGIGIDPAHRNRIFDLFEKLNPEGEGTGLGLTLVKRIVELYHGRIWIDSSSDPGRGCCVKFTLPVALAHHLSPKL